MLIILYTEVSIVYIVAGPVHCRYIVVSTHLPGPELALSIATWGLPENRSLHLQYSLVRDSNMRVTVRQSGGISYIFTTGNRNTWLGTRIRSFSVAASGKPDLTVQMGAKP